MKKFFKKLLCIYLFILLAIACSNKEKKIDMSKYEDLDAGALQLFEPDASLKNQTISIPSAKNITKWQSSDSVLSNVPQNILVSSADNLSKPRLYKAHDKFNRDYHFVGNTPVISNNKLFVLGNKSVVSAYNLSDIKKPKWKKAFANTEEDVFRGGGLFVANKYLAVTYGSNSISVLDVDTGKEKWKYIMSNISKTAPLIYKGRVFALTVDNRLYCLDLATGLLKWINEGASEQLGIIKTSSIIAYKNIIIVPYSIGQLYTVTIADGEQLWNLSLDDKFSSIGTLHTPIIDEGIAYVSSFKGTLYALNLGTGNIEWSNHSAGGNSIWLAGDYIFSVNKKSQLAAINKFTGKLKWIQNLSEDVISSRPIIVNKKLFIISSKGKALIFSPFTGKKIKEVQIAQRRYSAPIAVSSGLYLLSEQGDLAVF